MSADQGVAVGSAPAVGRHRLGIDFGTSHTVAVLCWPDGRTRPLLFDGTPQLPSAVFAGVDGGLHVGRAAHRAARTHPERLEPYPKRCIGLDRVFLGAESGVPVVALVEAVLRRVADEAARVTAGVEPMVVLSHPAGWGPRRRATLMTAAQRVFDRPLLVPEPVAAAAHFVGVAGQHIPDGGHALVYDLGAGTFDATVVRRNGTGFDVLATTGLVDAGGLDVDAAIVASLGTVHSGRNPAMWARLMDPRTVEDRRAARALWDEVRSAKEILSNEAAAVVAVPLFDEEAPLGREQLDALAGPVLERTVEATRQVLRDARLPASALAGLFLTGGGSRSPLVGTLLHRRLGVAPVAVEQPELAVAEGCSRIAIPWDRPVPVGPPPPAAAGTGSPFAAAVAPLAAPSSADPAVAAPDPAVGWGGVRRSEWAIAGAAALVLLLLLALVLAIALPDGDGGTPDRTDDGTLPGPTGTTGATGAPAAGDLDPCLVGSWLVTEHVLPYFQWRLRGSGQSVRIDGVGRFVLDFGTATVYRSPPELGTFRLSVTGTITHDLVTADGTIHTRNTRASGTVTADSGLGGPTTEQKLAGQPGPFGYRCVGDTFTLDVGQGQTLTMTRTGTR